MTAKQRILIVDDSPVNIKLLNGILRQDYQISVATNGKDALEIVNLKEQPQLILLDIIMPEMDGYEVCRRLQANPQTCDIPVLFVTAMSEIEDETKGLELGAVDYLTKPIRPAIVQARVKTHLKLKRHQDHLAELVKERTREVEQVKDATIHSMAVLAESRDPETGGHIRRTQTYVKILAQHLRNHPAYHDFLQDDETIELLYKSAPLHDVGKVGVKDQILLKPGKLTKEEFEEMKQHTVYGCKAILSAETMLGSNSFLQFAREFANSHHEKWDGSGYPQGLQGEEISIPGRLMAIADVYDALICKRVYKPAFTHEKAVEIMAEGAGSHFDPEMVAAFLELAEDFRDIARKFAD